MDVVGSLVRQLANHDAIAERASEGRATMLGDGWPEGREPPRRIQHVVFIAYGEKAALTLERACCSILMKSQLAMPSRQLAEQGASPASRARFEGAD